MIGFWLGIANMICAAINLLLYAYGDGGTASLGIGIFNGFVALWCKP